MITLARGLLLGALLFAPPILHAREAEAVEAKLFARMSVAAARAAGLETDRAVSFHRVELDRDALLASRAYPPALVLELPDGERIEFAPKYVARAPGADTWVGGNDRDRTALVTFVDDRAYGTAIAGEREFRVLTDATGRLHVAEVEPVVFSDGDCSALGAMRGPMASAVPFAWEATSIKSASDTCAANNPPPPQRTIDVLVLHSPSVADPILQAQHLIAETNMVFQNSGVTATAQLVGVAQTHPLERNRSHVSIVNELRCAAGQAGQNRCAATGSEAPPSDGSTPNYASYDVARMDEVFAVRDSVGADLVVLLVDQGITSNTACGVAIGPAADGDLLGPTGDYSSYAFAVVGDSCASGGSFTFVHEIGHLLGGLHDWSVVQFNGIRDNQAGANFYGYSRGFVSAAGHRDVMGSTGCTLTGCARLPFFSDPEKRDPNENAMGRLLPGVDNLNHVRRCRNALTQAGLDALGCPADMQCAAQQFVSVAEAYRPTAPVGGNGGAPGYVGGVTVGCALGVPGYNQVHITPPEGVVSHYVVDLRSVKYGNGTWYAHYSGPSTSPIVRPQTESYVRVAACNSGGCGPYVVSGQRANPSMYCP